MFESAQQGYARRPLCDLNGAEECLQSPLPYHQAGKVRLTVFEIKQMCIKRCLRQSSPVRSVLCTQDLYAQNDWAFG